MLHPNINALNLTIGENTMISSSASIRGIEAEAKKISIGDNVFIGDNVQIICDDFSIGDYGKIHHHTNIHGYKLCHIGHNFWIGQYSIIDSIGEVTIGHNCGIGAASQLWSHIKYGDTLEGCNFISNKSLTIGNDVWFVGHCIVSPIIAEDKSMALAGSVITKNMEYNCIYAGCPAENISHKMGYQFTKFNVEEKYNKMQDYLKHSGCDDGSIIIVKSTAGFQNDGKSYFDVSSRQYVKTRSNNEVKFIKYLLPEKAKFIPY